VSILDYLPDGVYLLQNMWDLGAFKAPGMWCQCWVSYSLCYEGWQCLHLQCSISL